MIVPERIERVLKLADRLFLVAGLHCDCGIRMHADDLGERLLVRGNKLALGEVHPVPEARSMLPNVRKTRERQAESTRFCCARRLAVAKHVA